MASVTRASALTELEEVAMDLSRIHRDLAELLAAEHQAKIHTWFNSNADYITQRDREADFNALSLTLDIIKLKGELAAQESRRAFLEFTVHWGTV